MKEDENLKADRIPEPDHMVVYRTEGVYQQLLLCEYLRDLSEDPGAEPESKTDPDPLPHPVMGQFDFCPY